MSERLNGGVPPQEHKKEPTHETEPGMEVFNPEIFERLKQALGITLPFKIEKKVHNAVGERGGFFYKPAFVGYEIYLPTPEGYYWHIGPERDPYLGTTWDHVSKEKVDAETGYEGTPVVKGGVGEWGAWCQEYGYESVKKELGILDMAVASMLGYDQFNQGSHRSTDFDEAVAWTKDYHGLK